MYSHDLLFYTNAKNYKEDVFYFRLFLFFFPDKPEEKFKRKIETKGGYDFN